jgi:hypothetical protein
MNADRTELPSLLSCFGFEQVIFFQVALLNRELPEAASWALTLALMMNHAHVMCPLMPAEIPGRRQRIRRVDLGFVLRHFSQLQRHARQIDQPEQSR